MVVIIKYYLVDSENVNDNWLMLLDLSDETDKIIVFYVIKLDMNFDYLFRSSYMPV